MIGPHSRSGDGSKRLRKASERLGRPCPILPHSPVPQQNVGGHDQFMTPARATLRCPPLSRSLPQSAFISPLRTVADNAAMWSTSPGLRRPPGILASTRSVFASAPPASRPSPQSRGTAGGRRRGRRSPCHGETGRRRDASGPATRPASMTTRLAPPSRGMPAILPKPSVLLVAVKSRPPRWMFRVFLATSMPAPGKVMVSRSHPRDGSVLQPGHPSGPRETIGMTGRPRFFTDPIARSKVISVRPAMRNPRCRRPRIGNEPGRESERKRRSCPRETRAILSTVTLSPVSDSSVIRGQINRQRGGKSAGGNC